MPDQIHFEVGIYSPRHGHDDVYRFELDRDVMRISGGGLKEAVCTWRDNLDPVWSGYREGQGDPFQEILENDSNYPPSIFVSAITHAWLEWRGGILDDAGIESEVKELCDWVNQVAHNKPTSNFWKGYF